MVVVIDPQIAGISGDMMLSSLVNIGASKSKIIDGIHLAEKSLSGSIIKNIEFKNVRKNGISATELFLDLDEETQQRKGLEIKNCLEKAISKIGLSEKTKKFAIKSIETLMEAESKIHGASLTSVHFHEASSIDTIVDILGTAIALEDLKLLDDEIVTTPVAVGGGKLTFSHGTTSNPANAILEIFKNSNISIIGGQMSDEITTPTGASMLVNLTNSCIEFFPRMTVKSIGYGAGKKNFDGFANVLKIIQGVKTENFDFDSVQILETNLDDVSGEVLGNLIEKIMANGAKDVTISPGITKKGRPTNLVSVICDFEYQNNIIDLLISETGTLGVRVRTSQRYIVPRTITSVPITIKDKNFIVRCKMTRQNEIIKNFKIESDDIKLISETIGLPFKQSEEKIKDLVREKLGIK